MKNNVTDSLNQIFDVETELVETTPAPQQSAVSPDIKEDFNTAPDIKEDFNTARNNIHEVITKGTVALDYLLELAKASEHPRAFEVVGQLTKTLVDANKDLLEIQKKFKDLSEEKKDSPQSVTNALFVGSTADLQKLIKGTNGDSNL